jgi:hypothetical protein
VQKESVGLFTGFCASLIAELIVNLIGRLTDDRQAIAKTSGEWLLGPA